MNILLSQSLKSFETYLLESNHRIGLLNDAWTGYAHYCHAGTTAGGVLPSSSGFPIKQDR